MTPKVSLRHALTDPDLLGSVLGGESWSTWRVLLLAAMGEPLEPEEFEIFTRLTGRQAVPGGRVEELLAVIGRRGGKSTAMAALAIYIGALCDHRDRLSIGEKGVVLLIAPDQRQAKIELDYAAGILESTPLLCQLIANRTADTLELTNGIVIEVRSASFRRLRGITCIAVIADEAAFWLDVETSSNPDSEIFNAVRPSLATTGGLLIIASSSYARKGEVWETYRRHYGADGDPKILVAQGASRDFNPILPQSVIDRALERDEAAARAEYLGQFRTDVESFIGLESLRACIHGSVRERQPVRAWRYVGFVDPSGGSADSFTLAVGHKEGSTCILDLVRETRPPFSPEAVVEEFVNTLKQYRITTVVGDRYGGEWVAAAFRKHGVNYSPSERTKSELYVDLLPLINSRAADLLHHERMVSQLINLERRVGRSGKDSIDHGPGGHDDVANAVAGAVTLASKLHGDGRDFRLRKERRGLDWRPTMPSRPISPGSEPGTGWMNL